MADNGDADIGVADMDVADKVVADIGVADKGEVERDVVGRGVLVKGVAVTGDDDMGVANCIGGCIVGAESIISAFLFWHIDDEARGRMDESTCVNVRGFGSSVLRMITSLLESPGDMGPASDDVAACVI